MIQIKLKKELKKEIEKKHKKWYRDNIYTNLKEEIKRLNTLQNKNNLEKKYLIFLKQLENKKENMAVLSNEEMIYFIQRYNYLYLDFKDFNKEIEKIKTLDLTMWQQEIDNLNKKSLFYKLEIKLTKNKEKTIKRSETKTFEKLKKIFNYEKFSSIQNDCDKWDRHKLITSLNINVCPYCQRNYISSYEENINKKDMIKKTTADLDHFYSQSEYPFLALSLYNFIPSCQICNSRMKGSKNTYGKIIKKQKVAYPYSENQFTGVFEATKGLELELIGIETPFEVKIKNITNEKTRELIKMFKLDKIYKTVHNKYLINMLNNVKNKPDSYLENIADFFIAEKYEIKDKKKIKREIREKLKDIVLEPYKFKVENGEPLGKLTKDILEEFGIDI